MIVVPVVVVAAAGVAPALVAVVVVVAAWKEHSYQEIQSFPNKDLVDYSSYSW